MVESTSPYQQIAGDTLARHATKNDQIYVKYRKVSTGKNCAGGLYLRGSPGAFIRLQSTIKKSETGQPVEFSVQIVPDNVFSVRAHHRELLLSRDAEVKRFTEAPDEMLPALPPTFSPAFPAAPASFYTLVSSDSEGTPEEDWFDRSFDVPPPVRLLTAATTAATNPGAQLLTHNFGFPTHETISFESDFEDDVSGEEELHQPKRKKRPLPCRAPAQGRTALQFTRKGRPPPQ